MVNINKKYDPNEAVIVSADISPAGLMTHTSASQIRFILIHMGYELPDKLPYDALISVFLDEITNNREWIPKMIPLPILEILIEIWEGEIIYVSEERFDCIDYLKLFGLAAYKKGNPISGEPNIIYIIDEMKDIFYYYLRSASTYSLMCMYQEWEDVTVGLMQLYGIMEIKKLHKIFCKVMKENISFDQYNDFLLSRSLVWGNYTFLEDRKGNRYIKTDVVEEADMQLLYRDQHPSLPYKCPDKDYLIMLCANGGIDNEWRGVNELALILSDVIGQDVYQITMTINSMVYSIENGCEIDEILLIVDALCDGDEDAALLVTQAVTKIYKSVPIFEYKGYSRTEYYKKKLQIEKKQRIESFKIITGGKA